MRRIMIVATVVVFAQVVGGFSPTPAQCIDLIFTAGNCKGPIYCTKNNIGIFECFCLREPIAE